MRPSRRDLALGAAAAAGAGVAGATGPAFAAAGGGFSVSGKPGPFVKQVAARNPGAGGSGAMGLATDAVNAGQYQAARLRMPQTEAKVAALLAGIDAQWPYGKGQPLRVEILGVDYYNAYSLADGSIVVAFGLLDQAQSDDEVAFVLAHELGHVRLGHFAAQSTPPSKAQLASRLGQAFLIGSALHAAGGAGGAIQSAGYRADATNDYLHFLTNVTVEPGHTRAQEDEADCIGFDLCQASAFAADSASARVFDTVQADQQKRAAVTTDLNAQLKQDLGQAITTGAAQSFLGGGLSPRGLGLGMLMGAGGLALASKAGGANAPPQHRPPEERKRGVAQYSTDAYPQGAPLRDEQHGWLTAVRGSGEYAQGKIAVEAVTDAKTARGKGDYPTASAAIAKAQATPFRATPLVLNEAARLRDDMGDAAGADKLFVQANTSPDQTIDGYLDFGRMLYRTQQNERAVTIIQEGTTRFSDPKPFLALLIAVAKQSGRQDEAARYLQQCLAYGDQALAQDCRIAAGESQAQHKSSPFGLPHL